MTDNAYHIAYKLIAEYGNAACWETQHKIKRYRMACDYNSLKAWYDVESALLEIQNTQSAAMTELELT